VTFFILQPILYKNSLQARLIKKEA